MIRRMRRMRRMRRAHMARVFAWFAAIFLIVIAIPATNATPPLVVYHHYENDDNKIALTFDDGPHPRYTLEILDILDEFGVCATFFPVGENISYYSNVAKEVVQRGHEIGNHTYTHPCASELSSEQIREELRRCEEIVRQVTGSTPRLFRPPQGSWNTRVYELARERDYSVILWDMDTRDWLHNPPEAITDYILKNIKSGNIILMHDYHTGGCTTTAALRMFIPKLLEQGYQFVTVSELLES